MTRLAIMAPKSYQEQIVETLHDSKAAHIEEFSSTGDDELDIGDPLPESGLASERLVRIRSLIRNLELDDAQPDRQLTGAEVLAGLDDELDDIAADVEAVTERVTQLERERASLVDELQNLEPLAELPLDLDDYTEYESLEVFAGLADETLEHELAAEVDRYEHFTGEDAHAVFVASDEADAVREVLTRAEFTELDLPEAEGSVRSALAEIERDLDDVERSLEDARARKRELAKEHKTLLLCAEEDLSITVEKTEAPLDFASTDRTFIVDAWVPTDAVDDVRNLVDRAAEGRVHVEKLDEGDRDTHDREEQPPTRYAHPTGVKPFDFLQETFSTPRYDEVDPTVILTIVFPLFLGFMIGDLGYGVVMAGLGFWLYRAHGGKSEVAYSLGFALLVAGLWSVLFGGIVFKDAFGIPIYHPHGDELWWGTLGVNLHVGEPIIHKLGSHGVREMLALSVLAAFVHLFLGFIFAFYNHLGHDAKHAIAQVGWISVLTGFLFMIALEGPHNAVSDWIVDVGGHPTVQQTFYAVGAGVLVLVFTEGLMGLMETVSLLANVISYTRLAGIAVAKGALVVAFNGLFLQDMALAAGSGIFVIAIGLLLFTVAQLFVFVLGLLSSSIQSIRLNYVEFFLKFFQGGGERFDPFGRARRFTLETDDTQEVQNQHG